MADSDDNLQKFLHKLVVVVPTETMKTVVISKESVTRIQANRREKELS